MCFFLGFSFPLFLPWKPKKNKANQRKPKETKGNRRKPKEIKGSERIPKEK
jgi:hypothetical protein